MRETSSGTGVRPGSTGDTVSGGAGPRYGGHVPTVLPGTLVGSADRREPLGERLSTPHAVSRPGAAYSEGSRTGLGATQDFAETGGSQWTLADLLREAPRRACALMHSDSVTILLLSEDGEHLAALGSCGLEEEVERQVLVPVGRGVAGRIAANRVSVILDDLREMEVVSPVLRERVRSLMGVPLLVEERVIGVVEVGAFGPSRFDEHDLGLLLQIADLAAHAIDHASMRGESGLAHLSQVELP